MKTSDPARTADTRLFARPRPADRANLRWKRVLPWSVALVPALWLAGSPTPVASAEFPPEIYLSSLDGSTGFALNGINGAPDVASAGDWSGVSVAGAGDVNGDGFDDIIIGAPYADPGGRTDAGQSYVVFGTDRGFPAQLELSTLDGTNGFALNGINGAPAELVLGDWSGISVDGVGDVNGDGFDDIMIGAPYADPGGRTDAGQSYVVFGTDQGFPAQFELSALDGANGFVLNGRDSGGKVAGAGDVNGDGLADMIVSAKHARAYLVLGSDQGFPASIELSALDGSNGAVLIGIIDFPIDFKGLRGRGAGDINGDGIGDIVMGDLNGAPDGKINAGRSHVVFGTDQGFPAQIPLSALDGRNGFTLNGIDAGDWAGEQVDGAGDVNGDGFDDVIIGAPSANRVGIFGTGQSYVVFGTDGGYPPEIELSSLDGNNGIALTGIRDGETMGRGVAGAGDINGDGIDDVVIGARSAPVDGMLLVGRSYVVFGTNEPLLPPEAGMWRLDGTNGFVLKGTSEEDFVGGSLAGAGDINGDGIDDIVIGAEYADPDGRAEAGQSYVVFGRPTLELTVSGSCPGNVIIEIAGAGPSGDVVLGSAAGRGVSTLPTGACAGIKLKLDQPRLEATLNADANGLVSLNATLTSEQCGRVLQSVDTSTCVVSNLARVP